MTNRDVWEQRFIEYLEYLEVERQVSGYTIRNYQLYIRRFLNWLFARKVLPHPSELVRKQISDYRLFLSRYADDQGKTLSRTTQSYYVIALRSWFKWMIKMGHEIVSPETIDLPKAESKRLTFLTLDQVERLLNMPRLSTLTGLRDKAMLEMLFSTGLRVSELVRLDRDQVNLEDREFGVIGKGRKMRIVFLSSRAAIWIERYLHTRRDAYSPLFVRYSRRNSGPNDDRRLTSRSVQRIVEKYRRQARLPVPITPHGLRHTFATDLLRKGAGLREVQELLGHKNVATTQIYTHVTNPQLKSVHEKYHSGNEG